jgi:hypothetical protein
MFLQWQHTNQQVTTRGFIVKIQLHVMSLMDGGNVNTWCNRMYEWCTLVVE